MERNTTAYQLNILRDTQMVQRRLLEKQFPYIDWSRMPFSSYGDFFRLRGIIDDCGAVWTNAYGRSNDEPDGQRNFLEDYSGNGRDIELFNFGWTDGSGYKDGAIVGDGVDDYGRCVKDFALPDDYTVVAMRETLVNSGTLIGKNESQGNPVKPGAFCFEIGKPEGVSLESYYDVSTGAGTTTIASMPKLFSYQTKSSYNGQELNVGSGTDTDACRLNIFRSGENTTYFKSAALFSFGIFTRTLTEEELRIVENCMYAEWIAMTGKLEDIEYYDILDARFRSNEEDADKRNKWVGRLGKLHMTLNNYAYSQMSGWNGYPGDFSTFTKNSDGTLVSKSQSKVTLKWGSDAWVGMIPYSSFPQGKYAVRVSFSNPNIQSALFIYYNTETSSSVANTQLTSGINVIDKTLSSQPNYVYVSSAEAKPGDEITIELIPDYGGALVSDGVDDNAVSDETIDEEIGGVVMHCAPIAVVSGNNGYIWRCGGGLGLANHNIGGVLTGDKKAVLGNPWTEFNRNDNEIYALSRVPGNPNGNLIIGHYTDESASSALYQLRLIKTQPTDAQLEAIKWQCRKEHDDYLIHMGWKEVE